MPTANDQPTDVQALCSARSPASRPAAGDRRPTGVPEGPAHRRLHERRRHGRPGLEEFGLIDVTSVSRDGSRRSVYGYRAVRYDIPCGCAAGYMPELNVLAGIADYSTQSGQPVTKHLTVEIAPRRHPEKDKSFHNGCGLLRSASR
jgi:hypothetical protein